MMMKPQNSFHLSRSLPEQEKIFKDLLYNLQLIHRKSLTRSSKTRKRRVTTRMEETALSVEDFCLSMTTERRHPRTLASAQRVAPEEEIQAPNDKELMVPRKRVRKVRRCAHLCLSPRFAHPFVSHSNKCFNSDTGTPYSNRFSQGRCSNHDVLLNVPTATPVPSFGAPS